MTRSGKAGTADLLQQREDLVELNNLDCATYDYNLDKDSIDAPADTMRDYSYDTDTELSDNSRYTYSFNDDASIGTNDTKITQISNLLPATKPVATKYTHDSFQKKLRLTETGIANMNNVLDCVKDILEQENEMVEKELARIIEEIDTSVPNHTYSVPINVISTRRKQSVTSKPNKIRQL